MLERCGLDLNGLGTRSVSITRLSAQELASRRLQMGLDVPDELRSSVSYVIGRQALIESHAVVLALATGNDEVAEIDASHLAVLVNVIGLEGFNEHVQRIGGPWSVRSDILSSVLLVLGKLASLQSSTVLEESGIRSDLLSKVIREEGETLERVKDKVDRSLIGSASSELEEELQRFRELLARWYMVDEEAYREVAALLGGGTSEELLELGSGRFNSIQEEYHLKRVNLLRSMGLDLLRAQKVAELPGGTIKPGWGC